MKQNRDYDIIVIGAGHAGCEAALAAARMGLSAAVFTMSLDSIGRMSCNPAIGGLAKSHLVKEIDALGGEMAKITDKAGIQFKILNKSKGPAVRATRVQADRALYSKYMRQALEAEAGLDIKQEIVEKILIDKNRGCGITTQECSYRAKAVIIATGTFLNGLIHIGPESSPAGRAGEPPSVNLSKSLSGLGFKIGRLKTGTPPRLDKQSIDFSVMDIQDGDAPPPPMSLFTKEITNPQLPCYITHTNERTHKIILDNLKYSPLYSGRIRGIGPRYCPSIEDKIVRFRDKPGHQVFLEPEGLDSDEYYANGISTSLPQEVQIKMVRSIRGLENAIINKPGYAIEYDFVYPTQLKPALETKLIQGLFLAGQINGTSGYEEAAAQGLIAGINAALKLKKKKPFILGRDEAYIGVLIDDLVTKGTKEPYRMFTSRAEYRLLLRQDNADLRLMEKGFNLGLINKTQFNALTEKKAAIEAEMKRIKATRVKPQIINPVLRKLGAAPVREDATLYQLLKRPEIKYANIAEVSSSGSGISQDIINQVEIRTKYKGYVRRQAELAEKFKKIEEKAIPECFIYKGIHGLSKEIIEKLEEVRPLNLGQAGRIPGVTPAAMSLLMIAVARQGHSKKGTKGQRHRGTE
ncbi:MAG TPA: tRNA uridine-5-carboxymethylaminomethyl(34) synthesis enzyme MnmG [Nitrospirae bacterium]|nr:tRNA uridine 5-carboxymethylaminomethyl modification enzyme MnmG [bacterium BMS3Abin06]HDH12576.1 tRNA uridine-5-carboxymethylaminomethyl(34) synthesis enzyme MnmG [Nitrospirota bacterium]HDZ00987.1 tRNA uridine-5-carboxymethylaminomethyl(34) synthesis enzyme MnmG [Nitrospirota bacterium]